jgi:4-diphosphocytidyl-2-C-methyl-D-erythritol kinase
LTGQLVTRAPGKINLCLYLGPPREDGKHDLVSVVQSVSLVDDVQLELDAHASRDEVVCPGVEGPNLALAALDAFRRETGWNAGRVRVTISKRVPVAAGMGGGSADAAAVLRLAARASGLGSADLLQRIAAELGADVPAALEPGAALATGAGERVERLSAARRDLGVVVLPAAGALSTADVFAEADRLGLPRDEADLAALHHEVSLRLAADGLPEELMVNDLEPAARSLYPAVDDALDEARRAGADRALVSGSGPTVAGLFFGADAGERARAAVAALEGRRPEAIAATPVTGEDG